MIEVDKFSNQLINDSPPSSGDNLMLILGYKDRPIPLYNSDYPSKSYLNWQKSNLKLHTCDQSYKIGRDTQRYMGSDISYSLHSYILETMTFFEGTIESLNNSPYLIEFREGFASTECSHGILHPIFLFEIEDCYILSLPADRAKETLFGLIFLEPTAEFESLSLVSSSPVGQFKASLAEIPSVFGNYDISPLDGVFSSSWVFCNQRGDIVFNEVAFILYGVVACISNYSINLFVCLSDILFGFLCKGFEKLPIPLISSRYTYCYRDGEFCIGNLDMDFVAKEAKVFTLSSPCGIGIRFFGLYVGGIYGEPKVFLLDEAEGLGYEICYDIGEGLLTQSLSEVVEGVVVWCISIGKPTEVGESSIVAEFSSEIPFGGGIAEVDEKELYCDRLGR